MLKGKYSQLLVALALLGMLYTLMREPLGRVIWNLTFWIVLLISIRTCAGRGQRILAWSLFAAALGFGIPGLYLFLQDPPHFLDSYLWLMVTLSVVHLAFFILVGKVVLTDVLTGDRVGVQKMYGAACLYILLGLAWAHAYQLIEALAGLGEGVGPVFMEHGEALSLGQDSMPTFLYFSFITLTTLGYGDIQPVHEVARLCAGAEAIVGQLYLTILVARLVGLHISQRGLEPD